MPVLYSFRIFREDLLANPGVAYVFGDNTKRTGLGGQAGQCRGAANAYGIATKESPSIYFHDSTLGSNIKIMQADVGAVEEQLKLGRLVVFPYEGVGTGLSAMSKQCPQTYLALRGMLWELGIKNGH